MAKVMAPVNDVSKKALEQAVSKGQPRRFVMIIKGVEVIGLSLFKKPAYDRVTSQMLAGGLRGTPICGIVTGSGKKLNFQIAGGELVARAMGLTDVYTREPIGGSKVKAFLTEEAEFSASATFELVTDPQKLLAVVDDENDDDLEAGPKVESSPESGSQQESSGDQKSPQEQSQEQPPWQDLYAELRATISVDLKRLAQTNPQFVEQLKPALESAKSLHGKGEFQQAFERLNKVSSILAAQAALARNDQVAQERPGKEKVREAGDAIELSQLNKILAELADAWARTRARLVEQLRAAERELLAVCIGQPNFEEVVAKSPRLYEVASELDLRLSERLGQASAAKEDLPAFIRATQRCLDVIADYRKFVSTDPKLAALKGATAELKINDLPELMNKTLTVLKTKVEFVKNAAEERSQRA